MTHVGVDLSSYQGQITDQEIQAMKFVGVEFVYVKATQGKDYINPDAPQQVKACRDAGFRVGLYHFFDPTTDVSEQAQYFFVAASSLGGSDLPIGLDSETPGSNWNTLATQMVAFAMQIENEPHVIRNNNTIFYVNLSYWDNLPGFPWGRGTWLADPSPFPHKACLIWQKAPKPLGPFASIDPDQWAGTEEQWALFLLSETGTQAPVAPTPSVTQAQYLEAVAAQEAKVVADQDALNKLEGK